MEDLGVVCAYDACFNGVLAGGKLSYKQCCIIRKPLHRPGLAFDAAQRKSTMTRSAISARGLNSTSDPETESKESL